jgi:hypothetical protein
MILNRHVGDGSVKPGRKVMYLHCSTVVFIVEQLCIYIVQRSYLLSNCLRCRLVWCQSLVLLR